jgi:hypothetical protein
MAAGIVDRRSHRDHDGRREVERRVFVMAPQRDVWAMVHDLSEFRFVFPELTLGPADPSWPAAGSFRLGEAHLGLLRTAVRIESLEARPGSSFRLAVVAAGFVIEWGWRMESLAGGTRVIHDGIFETHDRWAGVLVRLGRESMGSLAEYHLRALKERAEAAWRAASEAASRAAAGPAA